MGESVSRNTELPLLHFTHSTRLTHSPIFFTFNRKFFLFQLFNRMKKVRRNGFHVAYFIGWSGLNP